jgi:hypothetical protein
MPRRDGPVNTFWDYVTELQAITRNRFVSCRLSEFGTPRFQRRLDDASGLLKLGTAIATRVGLESAERALQARKQRTLSRDRWFGLSKCVKRLERSNRAE